MCIVQSVFEGRLATCYADPKANDKMGLGGLRAGYPNVILCL